jgi:hypothetical protein
MGLGASPPRVPPPPRTPQPIDTEAARRRAIAASATSPRTLLTDEDQRVAPASARSQRTLLGGT